MAARPDPTENAERGKPPHPVTIVVNNREIEMPDREATGAEIKTAAEIAIEFSLFHVHGSKLEPVADDETVKLHEKQQFRAVSGQDVS
jgi:hypothetical protein